MYLIGTSGQSSNLKTNYLTINLDKNVVLNSLTRKLAYIIDAHFNYADNYLIGLAKRWAFLASQIIIALKLRNKPLPVVALFVARTVKSAYTRP